MMSEPWAPPWIALGLAGPREPDLVGFMLVPVGADAPDTPPWDEDADEPKDVRGVMRIDFAHNEKSRVEINGIGFVGNGAKRDERTFALLVAFAMRPSNPSANMLSARLLKDLPGWRERSSKATLQSALSQLVAGSTIIKQQGSKGPGKPASYTLAVRAFLFKASRLKAWLYPEEPAEGDSLRRGPSGELLSGDLESWVSPGTQQVALVGQNLVTSLSRRDVRGAIATLLKESGRAGVSISVHLVVQSPGALAATYPPAAAHLFATTSRHLEELTEQLGDAAPRVRVHFHPGATLSMLVLDWNVEGRSPIVYFTPKLQVENESARRNYRATGGDYTALVGDFGKFLEEAGPRPRREGAAQVQLPGAAAEIAAEFARLQTRDPELYGSLKRYVDNERPKP